MPICTWYRHVSRFDPKVRLYPTLVATTQCYYPRVYYFTGVLLYFSCR